MCRIFGSSIGVFVGEYRIEELYIVIRMRFCK